MPLKPAPQIEQYDKAMARDLPITAASAPAKSYSETKDTRILYQGLTQAALQSMPLGQFASSKDEHIANVKAAVDDLAAFVLERSK